ncbi:hypothetical protein ACIRD4_30190 [Streptomyces clavifer]|uniref:hypothetical protein n=1 Tax=Streptomyces clavifer TaxID=68188 RepID=UPI0037FF49EC
MASAVQEDDPVDGPEDGDRTTAEQTSPCGPEIGPRPYVRLMTAVGASGLVAAAVATVLGLSTVPALPFPVDVPTPPGLTDLPSGLPSTLPTGFPTLDPGEPLPTEMPSFPTTFPSLPEFPQVGGVS